MWPDLFGSGWGWGALLSLGALGLFVAPIWLCGDPQTQRIFDAIQEIRARYDLGGLTRQEFERLKGRAGSARHPGEVRQGRPAGVYAEMWRDY